MAGDTSRSRPRLKAWMRENGMTQAMIAQRLEVQQSTVSAWVRGAGMSHEHAVKMRDLTGLTDGELLEIECSSSPDVNEAADDENSLTGTEG